MSKVLSHFFTINLIAIQAINTPAIGVFCMDFWVKFANQERAT